MKNLYLKTAFVAVFSLLSFPVFAQVEIDGICYNLNTNGTAEVTSKTPSYAGDIVIPPTIEYDGTSYTVNKIGAFAFEGCNDLTSVVIPENVRTLEQWAFANCTSLTSVSLPETLWEIGLYAFGSCTSLTSIDLPESLYQIREDAFAYSGLTSIHIPKYVRIVSPSGQSSFRSCSNLASITVDSENKTFDSRENCNAIIETATNTLIVGCQSTVIPSSVTSIGRGAFAGSGLTSITIPSSVKSVDVTAFSDCSSLTSVTIPASVTSIGNGAFSDCI